MSYSLLTLDVLLRAKEIYKREHNLILLHASGDLVWELLDQVQTVLDLEVFRNRLTPGEYDAIEQAMEEYVNGKV